MARPPRRRARASHAVNVDPTVAAACGGDRPHRRHPRQPADGHGRRARAARRLRLQRRTLPSDRPAPARHLAAGRLAHRAAECALDRDAGAVGRLRPRHGVVPERRARARITGRPTGSSGSSKRPSGRSSAWRRRWRFRRCAAWTHRHPFAAAMVLLAGTAALRYALVGVDAGPLERYAVPVVAWCFVAGLGGGPGNDAVDPMDGASCSSLAGLLRSTSSATPMRELIIGVGRLPALLWARPVPLPRWAAAIVQRRRQRIPGDLPDALAGLPAPGGPRTRWPRRSRQSSSAWPTTGCAVVVGRVVGRRPRRRIALDVDRRVQRGADEHRDRQDVQQQQHRDRRGQRPVDGRAGAPPKPSTQRTK